MQLIQQLGKQSPATECVVTGRAKDPEGFIDARRFFAGGDVAVSVAAAQEMARILGWHPPGEVDALAERLTKVTDELDELKNDLADIQAADRALERIAA